MRRILTVVAIAGIAAGTTMASPANAQTLLQFKHPTTGCTHSYYGPDVVIKTLPVPGVSQSGGFGASVDCP
jgi:hypothetical protein